MANENALRRSRIEAEIATESALRRSRVEAEIEASRLRRLYYPYIWKTWLNRYILHKYLIFIFFNLYYLLSWTIHLNCQFAIESNFYKFIP